MGKNKLILIVENDSDIRSSIKLYLDSFGYSCLEATDGDEAIELAKRESPDLILLDVGLGGINGFQVCHTLKSNDKFKSIPIIILTSKVESKDQAWGEKMGADAYLKKPFEFVKLKETINQLINKK